MSPNVKRGVIDILKDKFGNLYNERNVMISTTHTHSAPAGYHDYLLYSITSLGYTQRAKELMVYGIANAIIRAHNNLRTSYLVVSSSLLANASRNRSPTSYLANPKEERDYYSQEGDTEKKITLLRVLDLQENGFRDRASINWFSVHGTAMNESNKLLNGDNKGYAGGLLEYYMNDKNQYVPQSSSSTQKLRDSGENYIAAFSQSNEVRKFL